MSSYAIHPTPLTTLPPPDRHMRTWIIGSGGLLGSALARHAEDVFPGSPIPWHAPQEAVAVLRKDLARFTAEHSHEWTIIWAAGAATTASDDQQMDDELDTFQEFVQALSDVLPPGRGSFLLASSAGGVFAGSSTPPFDAHSPPVPLGLYGELKLAQEQRASELLGPKIPVVLARFANLYGIGQRLDKTQGLISTLVKAAFTRETVNIFVPFDTLRDYIFADDAARLALHWAHVAADQEQSGAVVRVIASGEPNSIGSVIAVVSDVTRIRIPVASGTHASAIVQARDLRLQPDQDDYTLKMQRTSLPVGVKTIALDLLNRLQQGGALRD